LRVASADARRLARLLDDALRVAGMLLEVRAELVVHQRLDETFHLAVAELGLVWPSNCGSGTFTAITASVPRGNRRLAALVVAFHEIRAGGVRVDRPRQCRLEPNEMRPTLDRMDAIGEGIDALAVPSFHCSAICASTPSRSPSM